MPRELYPRLRKLAQSIAKLRIDQKCDLCGGSGMLVRRQLRDGSLRYDPLPGGIPGEVVWDENGRCRSCGAPPSMFLIYDAPPPPPGPGQAWWLDGRVNSD